MEVHVRQLIVLFQTQMLNFQRQPVHGAYFLIHAIGFLAKNGRIAMLVPEAILQADYAITVKDRLQSCFDQVCLIHIRDRQFEGTDEAVVVVAASGYGGKARNIRFETVEQVSNVDSILNNTDCKFDCRHLITNKGRQVDHQAVQLLSELEQHHEVKRISEVATVRIGLVTGSNKHFIRSEKELRQLDIHNNSWIRLVPRTRWLSGLAFNTSDYQELLDREQPVVLVRPAPKHENAPGVRSWINEGIEAGVNERQKCSIRDPWFRIPLQPVPDAFGTCTRLDSPMLIANKARCWCTNALHSIYLHRNLNTSLSVVVVGFLTSIVSLWAELNGRRYGGGVLKIEPSTLNKAPVPLVEDAEYLFEDLDKLIRCGHEEVARSMADDLILGNQLGLSRTDIQILDKARSWLKVQRRPNKCGSSNG